MCRVITTMSMELAQALVIFAGSLLLKVSNTMDSKFFIVSCKGAYSVLAWHALQQSAHFGKLFMCFRPPEIPETGQNHQCNLGQYMQGNASEGPLQLLRLCQRSLWFNPVQIGFMASVDAGLQPSGDIQLLDDYRQRHALYRTDPGLQALTASTPLLAIWDDHEFMNNVMPFSRAS